MNHIAKGLGHRNVDEPSIIKRFEKYGCTVFRLYQPADLLVGYQGKTYLVEVQASNQASSRWQGEFFGEWQGSPIEIVKRPNDVNRLILNWAKGT